RDPVHSYRYKSNFSVRLVVNGGESSDAVERVVAPRHPLTASFIVDDDSLCHGGKVRFTNTSVYTSPAQFYWDFGDGFTDTLPDTEHVYSDTGVFRAMLVVHDFVRCSDTFYHTIVVDPRPYIGYTISDSVLCEGSRIDFE